MNQQSKSIVFTLLYIFSCSLSADTFITEISDKNINLTYSTDKNSNQSYPTSNMPDADFDRGGYIGVKLFF